MDEECEASLSSSLVGFSAPAEVMEDDMGPLTDMGGGGSLCIVPEDESSEPSLCRATLLQTKRARKGGVCNMRKSLAWNKAFFTEEGVLDAVELSILSGSLTTSGQKSSMSPLAEFNQSSGRRAFHDFEGKSCSKGTPKPQRKDTNESELVSKSEGPVCEVKPPHTVSGNISAAKGIYRSMPQGPTAYSQKRVANAITTNSTSKIPKFSTTKTRAASLPTPSVDVLLTAKSSKSNQSIVAGSLSNVPQSASLRSLSFSMKDSGYTSLTAKSSAHDSEKHVNPKEGKCTIALKAIPHPLFSTKSKRPPAGSGSRKQSSSFPQNPNHVSGFPLASSHAKPSALRMPSPTLGFFSQGKVSPSYGNQSQRNIRPSCSDTPLRKDINLGDFKPVPMLSGKEPTTLTTAAKSNSKGVMHATTAPNFQNSSVAAIGMHKLPKSNLEREQMDKIDRKDSNKCINSCSQGSGQQQLNSDSLSACEQSQELSCGKFDPVGIKQVPFEHSHLLQMNNEPLAEENRFTKQSLKIVAPGNIHDTDQPTRDSSKNETLRSNSSSPISFKEKPEESYFEHQQGDSGIDHVIWHTHVRDPECVGSATAVSSLRSSEEQMTHSAVSSNSEYSSVHKAGSLVNTEIPESASFAAEFLLMKSEEKEHQDCRLQCDVMNEIKPTKKGTVMLDRKRVPDNSKPDVIELKDQLNAVPFSDEWIAAVEAFGGDILELKTGTVQNSPTDKAPPEPGPWSPVKRKAQEIGPFDCTKYSKNISASNIQDNV